MANIVRIDPTYMCTRCGQTMLNVLDLKHHLVSCQKRNILCPLEHSNGHRCTIEFSHFHISQGLCNCISCCMVYMDATSVCQHIANMHITTFKSARKTLGNHSWIIHSFTLQDTTIVGYKTLHEN